MHHRLEVKVEGGIELPERLDQGQGQVQHQDVLDERLNLVGAILVHRFVE